MPRKDQRVSVMDIIAEYDPNLNPGRVLKGMLFILFLINVGCAVLLVMIKDGKSFNSFFINDWHMDSFYDHTADVFWIVLAQVVIFPLIAFCAVKSSKVPLEIIMADENVPVCSCFKCFYSNKESRTDTKTKGKYKSIGKNDSTILEEIGIPLLDSTSTEPTINPIHSILHNDSTSNGSATISTDSVPSLTEGFEAEDLAIKNDTIKLDAAYLKQRDDASQRQSYWLGLLFLFSTLIQVYLGLKCISFDFDDEGREGPLMGLGVLWVNMQVWVIREMITGETKETGELVSAIHPHKLHMHVTLAGHWCDLCGQPVTGGRVR
jgi:hypothetical protein